jgi:hypothetical protein
MNKLSGSNVIVIDRTKEDDEITPEILESIGFKHVNKASFRGSEMWCYQLMDIILLRFMANGLFEINPQNRTENIGGELKTKVDVENRILKRLNQKAHDTRKDRENS